MNSKEIITGSVRDPFNGNLYEGLIYSVEPKKVTSLLVKNIGDLPNFNMEFWDPYSGIFSFSFDVTYPTSDINRMFASDIADTNIGRIIKFINNIGYFISSYIFDGNYKSAYNPTKFREDFFKYSPENIIFTIERKYDEIDTSIPKFLYHITNKSFVNKIQSKGLIPKTKSKQSYHPDRIYFTKDEDHMKLFSNMLERFIPKEDQLILKISTDGLDNTFYKDPNLRTAIYTHQNINPQHIISYSTFD